MGVTYMKVKSHALINTTNMTSMANGIQPNSNLRYIVFSLKPFNLVTKLQQLITFLMDAMRFTMFHGNVIAIIPGKEFSTTIYTAFPVVIIYVNHVVILPLLVPVFHLLLL